MYADDQNFPFFSTQIERRRNSYWRNVFRYCQMNLTWRAFRRLEKKTDSKKQENIFLSSLSLLSSCSYYICDCTCRYYLIKFYKKIEQLNTLQTQKNRSVISDLKNIFNQVSLIKNVLYSLLYFLQQYKCKKTHLISVRARPVITAGIHHGMTFSAATHRSHRPYSGVFISNRIIFVMYVVSHEIRSLAFMTFHDGAP